jgi:hypothetical protein
LHHLDSLKWYNDQLYIVRNYIFDDYLKLFIYEVIVLYYFSKLNHLKLIHLFFKFIKIRASMIKLNKMAKHNFDVKVFRNKNDINDY